MEKFVPHSIDSDDLYDNRAPGDVKVGFSSSSADMRERLDIVKLLVKHRASTFFFRVGSMPVYDSTMSEGDIIIVDRAIDLYSGCKAICYIDGEFCVKRVEIADKRVLLMPVNELDSSILPIEINEQNSFFIWGVVTYVIKKM